MYKKLTIIVVCFLLFFLTSSLITQSEDTIHVDIPRIKKEPSHLLITDERDAILQPDRIVKMLKIRPGMTILDIGAGKGTFTFRFAKALKNTGKVFSTDVDPKMIEYINQKVVENQYKNIFPILVQNLGLDRFYTQHTFDIIFLCEVIPYIWNQEAYFTDLRPFLTKETGRLYIIQYKTSSDFHEIDFGEFKSVIKILISQGDKFPVFKNLDREVQDFIKSFNDKDVPSGIKNRILRNFNSMLSDRFLLNDFKKYFFEQNLVGTSLDATDVWAKPLMERISSGEALLVKWLVFFLDDAGVFDIKGNILNNTELRQLRMLNKILLRNMFHLDLTTILKGELGIPIPMGENSILSKIKAAGYDLVKEYDFLSQYYFLEFKRSK